MKRNKPICLSVFPAGPGRRRRSGDCLPKRTAKGASSIGAEEYPSAERGGDRILHADKGKPGGKKTAVSSLSFCGRGDPGESARDHQLPGSGAPHIREKFSKNGRDGHGTGRERRRPAERFL